MVLRLEDGGRIDEPAGTGVFDCCQTVGINTEMRRTEGNEVWLLDFGGRASINFATVASGNAVPQLEARGQVECHP